MQRRAFLKGTCGICLLGAAGMLVPGLESCGSSKSAIYKTGIQDGHIAIPLAMFATANLQQVRPKGWQYNIAVHQLEDKTYQAVLMKCTHMDFGLTVIGSGFVCNQHGSMYDKAGTVKKGPAEQALTRYKTEINGDNLIIYI
jgi:Rieske Fe-S protein